MYIDTHISAIGRYQTILSANRKLVGLYSNIYIWYTDLTTYCPSYCAKLSITSFCDSHYFFWCQVTSQPSNGSTSGSTPSRKTQTSGPKVRKSVSSRIHEAVKAIALCHNVTPVYESHASVNGETESAEADQDFSDDNRTYQASSPDEVNMRYGKQF